MLLSQPRAVFLALVALLALLMVGCASDGPRSAGASAGLSREIAQLHLLVFPMAVNLDAIPGRDGIAMKIFAGNPKRDKPFAVKEGTLEVLLFDGLLKSKEDAAAPFKTWSFPASELRKREFESTIGVGYELTLLWEDGRPKGPRATVMARYVREDGRAVYSAPNPISLN